MPGPTGPSSSAPGKVFLFNTKNKLGRQPVSAGKKAHCEKEFFFF